MSYIIYRKTKEKKETKNPTPDELLNLLEEDFFQMNFSSENAKDFKIYYNGFTGELTAEFYNKDKEEYEIELTERKSIIKALYEKYFYKFI